MSNSLFGFVETGQTFWKVFHAREQNKSAGCEYVSNDAQVKRSWMFACQTRYTFWPRSQLQVGAMVWLVWAKI